MKQLFLNPFGCWQPVDIPGMDKHGRAGMKCKFSDLSESGLPRKTPRMDKPTPTTQNYIRELFPALAEGQLKEVEENLIRYGEIALQIFGVTKPAAERLDHSQSLARMKERSNPSLKSNPSEHG